jgi:hypothetical protein
VPTEVSGAARRARKRPGEGQGPTGPIDVTHGLQVAIKASEKHMQ